MEAFQSADEILDFAIEREEEAFAFYDDMSNGADNQRLRELFDSFAQEELRHKAKLIEMKKGKMLVPSAGKITDLKIADYLVESKPGPVMNYPEALRLAMQREKTAFRLYNDLAERADTESLRNLFLSLAREEAKHKLRLELEYDENIMQED
ncbi:MAG: ferritin-like domain-containing protein [Candidatus Latescibacterota bacterium]